MQLVGFRRVLGVVRDGTRQRLHGGDGLLQGRGLLFGASRKIGVAPGDLVGGMSDGIGGQTDAADDLRQLLRRPVGIAPELVEAARISLGDRLRQIAARHGALSRTEVVHERLH